MGGDVVAGEVVGALRRAAPPAGDELAEIAVARAVGGEQHELDTIGERDLAADHERQPACLRGEMGAHHPGHRALVGEGEGAIAERLRPLHQLLGVRGPAQEGEIGQAMELGVGGQHGVRPIPHEYTVSDATPDPAA